MQYVNLLSDQFRVSTGQVHCIILSFLLDYLWTMSLFLAFQNGQHVNGSIMNELFELIAIYSPISSSLKSSKLQLCVVSLLLHFFPL